MCSEIVAIFSRRFANDPSEGAIKRGHRLESGFRCHFAHPASGITQQHARIFDPAPCYVVAKLKAGRLAEQRAEMKHTGPGSVRH